MTDFPRKVDTDYDWLIDLVRRDLAHHGTADRLSYDLDGAGHFDLVRTDDGAEDAVDD